MTQFVEPRGVALLGAVTAAFVWLLNGVTVLTASGAPSVKGLCVVLAFAVSGAALGRILVEVHRLRHPLTRLAPPEASTQLLGVTLVGLAMQPVFSGDLSTFEWWWLVAGSVVAGVMFGGRRPGLRAEPARDDIPTALR